MRFAAMSTMIDLDRRLTHDRLLDTLREQAALADEVGLETIWLGEHHFGPYGAGNSPNAIAGARIGYKLQVSPPPGSADFGDVPTNHQFFQFIEALYHSGITAGCGGGNSCPTTR